MTKEQNNDKTTKKSTRRDFLKKTSLGAGVVTTLSASSFIPKNKKVELENVDNINPNDLSIKMTGYDYPRVKAIFDKKVKIKGYTFDMAKSGGIGDMNTDIFSGAQSYDVSEVGIVPFILAYANEGFRDYTLLPIFPLRTFRHKSIFINTNSGIAKPQDLKGKKIGTPGYSSSSLTWIRGMLQDEYGISPNDVEWVLANMDSSADIGGKASKQENVMPEGLSATYGTKGKDESDLLLSGETDALFHAVQPKAFIQGNPKIKRLFEDSKKVEQEYFTKTGIFPIMHAVAIKKDLLKNNPRLAESIFNAYSESKTMNYNFMIKLGWAYDTLPWYGQEIEDTIKVMGNNFYPYGIEVNRKVLERICRYTYEQGLSKKKLSIEDLFHSSSLEFIET